MSTWGPNISDEQLIEGCKSGDTSAQWHLYKRYAGRMLVVCMRYTRSRQEAEDCLQDGFIKVFDNISRFNFSGSFEGWVRRIMVNCALKNYRRLSFHNEILQDDEIEASFDQGIVSRISEKELLDLISRLPDGYRMVFNLFAIEGYEHKEIAAMMSINEGTSRSQLNKARTWLQRELDKLHPKKKNNNSNVVYQN